MPKAPFKDQQSYLWALVKRAGWDKAVPNQKHSRFAAYLLKNFKVTHANALDEHQMRQAIATLKPYAAKAAHDAKKRLHSAIMSHAARNGFNEAWVHQMMKEWGYGESLRECNFRQVQAIFVLIKKALP
jgi:hypothetical protein